MKRLFFLLLFLPFFSQAQTSGFFNMSQTQQPRNGPTLSPTGTLSAFSTFVGSSSTVQTFQISGFNLTASGIVTCASPMEISLDNTTYVTTTLTIPLSGTALSGQPVVVYVRIKSSASVGSYSGNIAVSSTGATTVNEAFTASVLNIPVINETGTLSSFSTTTGNASTAQTFTFTGSNLLGNVVWTAGTGMEVSSDGTTYGNTAVYTPTSGSISSSTVYTRISGATSVGSYSGNIAGTSTSATTVNVAYSATVTAGAVAHYRSITIPSGTVSSTLTNFPVLVTGTLSYLATLANGGKVASSNGYDITFSTDAAGTSALSWDMESYNPVTGAFAAWVKIPSVASGAATVFYMHYGNSSITTFQGNTAGTWDANFGAVWHMSTTLTGSGQTVPDVTTNANNLTANGTWISGQQIAGQIGGALQLTHSSSNYFSIGTPFAFGNSSDYTLEAWVNLSVADNTSYTFNDVTNGSSFNWFSATGRIFNGSSDLAVAPATASTSTWYYIVVTKDHGTNTEKVYQNATAGSGGTSFNGITVSNLGDLTAGTTSNIKYDEVRISNTVRSAAWISACYLNQSTPASFYTIGAEN